MKITVSEKIEKEKAKVLLVDESMRALILVRNPEHAYRPSGLDLPGGKRERDKGETFWGALVRETLEEINVRLKSEEVVYLGDYSSPGTNGLRVRHYWAAVIRDEAEFDANFRFSDEHVDMFRHPLEDLGQLDGLPDHMKRAALDNIGTVRSLVANQVQIEPVQFKPVHSELELV